MASKTVKHGTKLSVLAWVPLGGGDGELNAVPKIISGKPLRYFSRGSVASLTCSLSVSGTAESPLGDRSFRTIWGDNTKGARPAKSRPSVGWSSRLFPLWLAHLAGGVALRDSFALGNGILAVAQITAGPAVIFRAGVGNVHCPAARLFRLGLGLHGLFGRPIRIVFLAIDGLVGAYLHVVLRTSLQLRDLLRGGIFLLAIPS